MMRSYLEPQNPQNHRVQKKIKEPNEMFVVWSVRIVICRPNVHKKSRFGHVSSSKLKPSCFFCQTVCTYILSLPGTLNNIKQPLFIGCFSWMIPNLYIKKWLFSPKSPFKTGWLSGTRCKGRRVKRWVFFGGVLFNQKTSPFTQVMSPNRKFPELIEA